MVDSATHVGLIGRREILALPLPFTSFLNAQTKLRPEARLSFTGLGPVRIGMSAAQIRAVIAGPLTSYELDAGADCYSLTPRLEGLSFMMLEERLSRIDVHAGTWRTVSGAGIGMSESRVKALYGRDLTVEPHHYTGPVGKYLIVRPRDSTYNGFKMLFETDGKVLTNFRAGLAEAVGLVEGCA